MLVMGTAFAEEAALVSDHALRITLVPSFGYQIQEWEWEGGVSSEKVMLASVGIGLEYGPADWINFQLFWIQGYNVYSEIADGDYGSMTDLFLGVKIGLWGESALIQSEKIRFSFAPGIKVPLGGFNTVDQADTVREPDQHLWGSALRLYIDYVINPLFFVNVYLEGIYYPKQWTYNPAYKTHLVNHLVDITPEIEVHFRYPLQNKNIALKAGLSASFFIAPIMNSNDDDATSQYRFCGGAYFGAEFGPSFDLMVSYLFPVAGKNTEPVHLASLVARYTIGKK